MITTYDSNPTESARTYHDIDPTESVSTPHATDQNTNTIAEAWASSPFDEPESDDEYGFTAPAQPVIDADSDATRSVAKHAIVIGSVACGIGVGAALGLIFFNPTLLQPTAVVPEVGTSPHDAVVVTPTDQTPSPKPVEPAQETQLATVATAPAHRPAAAAPGLPPVGTPDVGTPPAPAAPDTTVVIDIPIPDFPPLPEKPEQPDPEPPQPPDVPDLDFKLPEPPQPEPDPDPPTFAPDLQLAPLPQPNPQPDPPGPPNFVPPVKAGP